MHLQNEDAVREPAPGCPAQVLGGRGFHSLQRRLVGVRAAAEHLAGGQPVRLAPESPDALDAPNETRHVIALGALQLVRRRSGFEKTRQFFVCGILHLRQLVARPRRHLNIKLSADLTGIDICGYIGGNLIVIHQPLIEARSFAGR
jgi:hypothetical protein